MVSKGGSSLSLFDLNLSLPDLPLTSAQPAISTRGFVLQVFFLLSMSKGEAFYLQLELFCLQLSLFTYSLCRCFFRRTLHM